MSDGKQHFWASGPSTGTNTASERFEPRVYQIEKVKAIQPSPGVRMRGIIGDKLMANFVYSEPHVEVPVHQHEQEQITIILEGEMDLVVSGVKYPLHEGEALTIPPNAPHGAFTHDKSCRVLDVFTPPRLFPGAPEVD